MEGVAKEWAARKRFAHFVRLQPQLAEKEGKPPYHCARLFEKAAALDRSHKWATRSLRDFVANTLHLTPDIPQVRPEDVEATMPR